MAITAGCVDDGSGDAIDEGGWETEGKADDPNAEGVTATSTPSAMLLDGFHKLLDTTANRCVEPGAGGPEYTVGAVTKPFDVYVVSSREELARKLGVDLDLRVKYGVASGNGGIDFLDNFVRTRSAVHLLVSARASYRVSSTRTPRLTDEALLLLGSDPRTFLHRCGNFFVSGVEYEAQLFVMIRFDLRTDDATRNLAGELGLAGNIGVVNLDGTLKANMETVARNSDVRVDMHVLDRGFLVDGGTSGLMASLLGGSVTAETFTKIDSVRAAMLTSLQNDLCRDGGSTTGTCSGPTPGYNENRTRYAVPVRVDLRPYSRAMNAPIGGPGSPYDVNRQTLDRANQYLRTVAKMSSRLDAIQEEELLPFLGASDGAQALYGIAPPARPVYSIEALREKADEYSTRIDLQRAVIDDIVTQCWAALTEGAPEACATPDARSAATLPVMVGAAELIEEYQAKGRVLPLQFASVGLQAGDRARNACATKGMRLPSWDEATRLALPIRYATLPRSDDPILTYAAWHTDQSRCTGGKYPAFGNSTTTTSICVAPGYWTKPVTTLCIPAQGPFANAAQR